MTYDFMTDGLPPEARSLAEHIEQQVHDDYEARRSTGPKRPTTRLAEIKGKMLPLDQIEPVLSSNYLVKGWLGLNCLGALYGPSNAGKTFMAIDMGMHVAAGERWRDCRVQQGPVLYIAAEGGSGVLNRLAAFKAEHPNMARAPFTLLPVGVDLHGSGDADVIISAVGKSPLALVVVDTLARSMGEGEENSAKDMGMFVRNCDRIREATGATVLIIHHTGKDEDKGGRGSSALRAAVDTEILLTSSHCITSKKQRDMAAPNDLHFSLRTVTLGMDADGDPVTSKVVDPADKPPVVLKPLSGKNQVAMTALAEALRKHGRADMGSDYPNCTVVAVEHWRDACAEHGLTTGGSDSAARTAFMRAKTKLIDLDRVREFGGHVWKVRDDA